MRRTLLAAVLSLASFSAAAPLASACPACKDTIAGGDTSTGLADTNAGPGNMMSGPALPGGFNSSVYLMLGSFVGILGFVGYTIVKGSK